jgi:hypothetical protein
MTPTLTHRSENVKVSELPMLAAHQQAAGSICSVAAEAEEGALRVRVNM